MAKQKQTEAVEAPESNVVTETKTYTPKELADMTGADPKRIRAWLRANYPRAIEAKNTTWTISHEVALAVIGQFSPSDEPDEEA